MTKLSSDQRLKRAGQPYTRISLETRHEEVETEIDGKALKGLKPTTGLAIYGYTLEFKLNPTKDDKADPEWEQIWEEHDLGQEPTLEEAHVKAHDWRESLNGVYPIG